MCKRLIVSFIFVLSLAAISCGEVIGDWEQNMDGWVDEGGTTLSYSTIGVTRGSWSLKVVTPAGPSWYDVIGDKILNTGQISKIMDGTYTEFTLDVSRFTYPGDGWTTIDEGWGWLTPESRLFFSLSADAYNEYGVLRSVGAGREILGANWYPSTIPPDRLPPWKPIPDPDGTMTAVWSLVDEVANIKRELTDMGYIYTTADCDFIGLNSMDIRLIANPTCWVGPSTYYLDNAQLIPEPATMALLGLGLALIRRKR